MKQDLEILIGLYKRHVPWITITLDITKSVSALRKRVRQTSVLPKTMEERLAIRRLRKALRTITIEELRELRRIA